MVCDGWVVSFGGEVVGGEWVGWLWFVGGWNDK